MRYAHLSGLLDLRPEVLMGNFGTVYEACPLIQLHCPLDSFCLFLNQN